MEEGRLEEEDMIAVGPNHPQEALRGGGCNLWVYRPLEAIPAPKEDKTSNTELRGTLVRAGLCNTDAP